MVIADPPYNPAPAGAEYGFVKTEDGIDIRYAFWKSTSFPIKGTVLLLHGRAEYIEKLYETVNDLRKSGFDVLTFDWRGQGGSSRLLRDARRGYVDHFEHYLFDLDAIMKEVALPECKAPYYVLAHSTGSLVALLAAPDFSNRIRRMVLSAPLLGLGNSPISQSAARTISGFLCALGLGQVYMAGGATPDENRPFAGNRLTSDTRRFDRNLKFVEEHRELSIGGPTAAWLYAAGRAMNQVMDPDFHSRITIPVLLVAAGADEVVSNAEIEELGRRLRSGSTLTIDGARHEILQEKDHYREQLLAAFNAFVPGTEELETR